MVQHVGEDTLELEVDSLGYIDHADQLSDETMRLMKEKQIFAVPTFTIFEYFADHAATPEQGAHQRQMLDVKAQEFKKQVAAGRAASGPAERCKAARMGRSDRCAAGRVPRGRRCRAG